MIAAAQHTIVDLADPIVSGTAPTSPIVDMLWMDTSVSPALLKRWNGSTWELVNDAQIGSRNLIADGCFRNGVFGTSDAFVALYGAMGLLSNFDKDVISIDYHWFALKSSDSSDSDSSTSSEPALVGGWYNGKSRLFFGGDVALIHSSFRTGAKIQPQKTYTLSMTMTLEGAGENVDMATLSEWPVPMSANFSLMDQPDLSVNYEVPLELEVESFTPASTKQVTAGDGTTSTVATSSPSVKLRTSFVSPNEVPMNFLFMLSPSLASTEISMTVTEIQLEEGSVATAWQEERSIAQLPAGDGRNLIVDGKFSTEPEASNNINHYFVYESSYITQSDIMQIDEYSSSWQYVGDNNSFESTIPESRFFAVTAESAIEQKSARFGITLSPNTPYTLSLDAFSWENMLIGYHSSPFVSLAALITFYDMTYQKIGTSLITGFGAIGQKVYFDELPTVRLAKTFITPSCKIETSETPGDLPMYASVTFMGGTYPAYFALISNIKLEKGATATDWSEAPEAYATPFYSAEPPMIPVVGGLWMDLSSDPPVLRMWTKEGWVHVDESLIGGRNLLRHSGNFKDVPDDWTCINPSGVILSTSAEMEADMLRVETTPGEGNSAAIRQTRTYLLDFDTTYVYQAKYRVNHSGDGVKFNPLSFFATVVDDPSTEPTDRSAVLNGDDGVEVITDDRVDTGIWEHTVVRFKTCSRTSDASYITFQPRLEGELLVNTSADDAGVTHFWLQWIMLEKGNTASDWSPAPEDAQEELDKIQGELDGIAEWQTKTELKLQDDRIIATVLGSKEYTTKIESIEAGMQLTKDEFDVRFTEINQQIIDNEANDSAFRNEVTSWMNFSKDAVLEIGKSDSDFKMNLSNTQLSFLYKGTEMAYFGTDNGMYINKAVIKDSLTVGNITMVGDSKGRMLWV